MVLRDITNAYSKIIPLEDFMCIGRSTDNHLVLDGSDVSDRHARIERKKDHFILRDLRSESGTALNGAPVKEETLNIGDRVSIGHHVFEVQSADPALRSRSLAWQAELSRIPAFSKTDLSVLLLGPSGSGKEILSKSIHQNSARANGPLVIVNCSALTESLAESELFGHVKGSFTGATQDRKGAFESAKHGTLVLDEIGDLPLNLQPKLLRALDNKEIKPVGSDTTVSTNVRIIACTHQNLKQKVEAGEFRLDLFYRLNIVQIQVPPLKDRMEDFGDIVFSLCKELKLKVRDGALQELRSHSWPGNIRELKNLLSRLKALHATDPVSRKEIYKVFEKRTVRSDAFGQLDIPFNRGGRRASVIKEIERQIISQQLLINGGNQRRTANDLGIPRSTLNDKIKTYNIDIHAILREKLSGEPRIVV